MSIVDAEPMLTISKDTASVGIVHESIANVGVSEKCLEAVRGLEVDLGSTLCTSVLRLTHNDFLRGA